MSNLYDLTGNTDKDKLQALTDHLRLRLPELMELEENMRPNDLGIGLAIDIVLECLDTLD